MKKVFPKQKAPLILTTLLLLAYELPTYAASLDQLAQKMLNAQFYEEAYPILRRMAKEDPDNAETHYWIAKCLDFMGRRLRAIQEYQIYLRLAPEGTRASICRSEIESWTSEISKKGEKYTLSNLDMWFKDYYNNKPYHSWDEDPSPDWVKKHDEKHVFSVDVHFVKVHPDQSALVQAGQNWRGWFLTSFHDLWEMSAKTVDANGFADLYIRMLKNGHLEPIIVMCDGNSKFENVLRSTLATFDDNEHLREPCSQDTLIKAHIFAGAVRLKKRYASDYAWVTKDELAGLIDPTTMRAISPLLAPR